MTKCKQCGQLNGVHKMSCKSLNKQLMENYTLYYTFNGKKYKSTVLATDRIHAMNLIKNKIEFINEPKNKNDDFLNFFNDITNGKTK